MGFLNLFGGDSASSSTNNTYDQKIGASENGIAQRVDNASGGTVNIGSDNIAEAAIQASSNNLTANYNFVDKALDKILSNMDSRSKSAEANLAATQQIAAEAISKGQATSSDEFMKLILIAGGIGLAYIAIKSGVFK